ncbi:ATP-binding protein [Psychromonas sp.]|nr:ATP-binding protein [Psychromonas sp.]
MKIHNKLFLILFSFSLLLVTVLVLLIQWSIGKGMVEYVNSKEVDALKPMIVQLEIEYQKNNDWSILLGQQKKFGDLLFSTLDQSEFIPPHDAKMRPRRPPDFRDSDPQLLSDNRQPREVSSSNKERSSDAKSPRPEEQAGYALLDNQQNLVVGHYLKSADNTKTAVIVNQTTVGWLIVPKRHRITDGYELDFIEQQQNYLWIIALTVMLLVTLISLLLARHIAEPMKLIMLGMHKLTQGDYEQNINLKRKDELGELSRDFNELALTLHENESARKRWLANISHELRTPIAILRGELEAMLDGVRTLDTNNIGSANDEVKHLQHLIDDLHQLTSADIGGMHYRKKNTDLGEWLATYINKYTSYLEAHGITLVVKVDGVQASVFADSIRLCQLFENLMNNCIKYAEASLMKISLELDESSQDGIARVVIEDNGVGVPNKHLPHLFEHLYRVENSRNRKTGGSGLGLSICAHIVAAHQGTIIAERSKLGGLAIIIEIPLSH